MNLLTQVVDLFKARSPKTFAIIVTVLTVIQILCINIINIHADLIEPFPVIGTIEWLAVVPEWLAKILSAATWLLAALVGASTKGNGKLIHMTMYHTTEDGKVYNKGGKYYVNEKLAEKLKVLGKADYIHVQ